MHDVQLHFGDLQKSWGRHKPEAVGLLFNLLCAYYDREKPLPDDMELIADLAGATTESQQSLLFRLLKRHLRREEVNGGFVWKWPRCDTEIARYQYRCKVNAYNNLKKFVGNSNGKLFLPSFEVFQAQTEHFRDPVLGHFRNLEKPFQIGTPPVPKSSESETLGAPKVPTSGDHSPTLPLSHSPTLPIIPPVVPQGGQEPAAAVAADPDSSKVDSDTSETGVSDSKKKKRVGRVVEPLAWPDGWTGKRREVMEDWLRYKSEKGQRYKPTGFAALLRKLDGLPVERLRAVVEESMSANYSGLFPERQGAGSARPVAVQKPNGKSVKSWAERQSDKDQAQSDELDALPRLPVDDPEPEWTWREISNRLYGHVWAEWSDVPEDNRREMSKENALDEGLRSPASATTTDQL